MCSAVNRRAAGAFSSRPVSLGLSCTDQLAGPDSLQLWSSRDESDPSQEWASTRSASAVAVGVWMSPSKRIASHRNKAGVHYDRIWLRKGADSLAKRRTTETASCKGSFAGWKGHGRIPPLTSA